MVTRSIQVLSEADLLAAGGTVGSNGTFASTGSEFTFDENAMPWFTLEIVDNGSDTTTLSSDTDPNNTDGGANSDNEGSDGETGTIYDPDGNQVGTAGRVAADRWATLQGDDGSVIHIYEIETFDDFDVYTFSAPLSHGVTYSVTHENARDTPFQYSQMLCLARGTPILTPNGFVPIEALSIGDRVETADHGAQVIRWIATSKHVLSAFGQDYGTRPVKIQKSTFGNTEDIVLSPQHRVLLSYVIEGDLKYGFAPAKVLAEEFDGRVRYAKGVKVVEFYNLMFDRHEVIYAAGARVESFYPGLEAQKATSFQTAGEIKARFPKLRDARSPSGIAETYGPVAHEILSRSAIRKIFRSGCLDSQQTPCADFGRSAPADPIFPQSQPTGSHFSTHLPCPSAPTDPR